MHFPEAATDDLNRVNIQKFRVNIKKFSAMFRELLILKSRNEMCF